MSLRSLQEQWLTMWEEMDSLDKPSGITLAAPFFSVDAKSTIERKDRTILMVGKATHRDWYLHSFKRVRIKSVSERIEERRSSTVDFLINQKEYQRSFFWQFYRSLSARAGAAVIWSNLAKIGVSRPKDERNPINPWGPFLLRQKGLAQKTLWAELAEYQPDLVVLVTGSYALEEITYPAFGERVSWSEGTANGHPFWFLNRSGNHPPVLHTGHPAFRSSIERELWITKAMELLGSGS